MELRLSEAFEGRKDGIDPCLDCRAVVLNINSGHNRELLGKCRRLREYSEFIREIRQNLYGMIQDGILSVEQLAERTGERKAEFLDWYEKRRMK